MAKQNGGGQGDGGHGNPNQLTLTVVVNGQAFPVTVNIHAPLHTLIPEALRVSNTSGQPPENWELKDANGTLLDLNKKIEDFGFTSQTVLFMNLKTGAAGER